MTSFGAEVYRKGAAKMAWFRNRYVCPECNRFWDDEWSSMCDDRCGDCDIKGITPFESEDLSAIVERSGPDQFSILISSEDAGESANYVRAMSFKVRSWPTNERQKAEISKASP